MESQVGESEFIQLCKRKPSDSFIGKKAKDLSKKLLDPNNCFVCHNSFFNKRNVPRIMIQCGNLSFQIILFSNFL